MFDLNTLFKKSNNDYVNYEIALVGNPNVGKSTIFNSLTKMNQHTGNWSGKTVKVAVGKTVLEDNVFTVVDLPGAYSMNSDSKDEMVTSEYIKSCDYSCIVFVVDATNIERNLCFILQALSYCKKAVLCINQIDVAEKENINIDFDELSLQLGIPVVKTSANRKIGINTLKSTISDVATEKIKTYEIQAIPKLSDFSDYNEYVNKIYKYSSKICSLCVKFSENVNHQHSIMDRLLVSKGTGIPIMLLMLAVLFLITVYGANYISELLYSLFTIIESKLVSYSVRLGMNETLKSFIFDGIYTTVTWIVSVMLPPMSIFFPLFSLMEDAGLLPRIAFNMDKMFQKSGTNGKQALTMAMGFGCNACGVTGCRIIESENERAAAIVTNNIIPCNGRLPSLIAVISIFLVTTTSIIMDSLYTTFILLSVLFFCVISTLIITKLLRKFIFKGDGSTFILEIPKYKKPQFLKTILYSLKDRALFVLLRAVAVALPAGAVIWTLANIEYNDITLIKHLTDILDPFARFLGIDGVIIMAFILGFPANETVIPIILMSYLSTSTLSEYNSVSELGALLLSNGWDIKTAICFLIICVFHFPCSTTCITIYKETKNIRLTLLSIVIPTAIGLLLCLLVNTFF